MKNPRSYILTLVIVSLLGFTVLGQDSSSPPAVPVLHLANGDFAPGKLAASDQPGIVRWQAAAFARPFEFALGALREVRFPVPAQPPAPAGDYRFELAGGDVLYGAPVSLSADELTLDETRSGRIRLARAAVLRIHRWRDNHELVYLGPNGLDGWTESGRERRWREDSGHVLTDEKGASIQGDMKLPAQAIVEFELSWTKPPDFVVAIGSPTEEAFRFEVWDGDLVVLRETAQDVDLASLHKVAAGPGRLHLLAYLDQEQERIQVFSGGGKELASLAVAGGKPQSGSSIRLVNKNGDLRLERLRIGRWNGEPPREVDAGKSRLERNDGSIVYGQVTAFDADAREFVLSDSQGEARVAAGAVESIFLSAPGKAPEVSVRAVYLDGSRIGGELASVEDAHLVLACPHVAEPLRLPLAGLRSLTVLPGETQPAARASLGGALELDDLRLRGRLVDARAQANASCLAWQPDGSATDSPLKHEVSGRIVYRERAKAAPRQEPAPTDLGGAILRVFTGGGSRPSGSPSSLHLRAGDIIPCEIISIDDRGVSFNTLISDAQFVPHDKVQAVELRKTSGAAKLQDDKRQRLLTLPRLQKHNPPTHLVRSTNGDYLRGRLSSLDDKTLSIEVRLEEKQVPRDRVSRIIWLHPEGAEKPADEVAGAPAPIATRVQALRSDGIRLTFHADALEANVLSGASDVLGPCRVDLAKVDQLLIGGRIEREAARLAFQQWKLEHAAEPLAATEGEGAGESGTESPLVGKPAPDFSLKLLDGKTFRLSGRKGRVVVLDFWATWCGPCLETMPLVAGAVEPFRDQGVELLAVNQQETPEEITGTLQRLQLDLAVALDQDAKVAERYAAASLPYTVVVDREGNVARVFVGGSPSSGEELTEALKAIVAPAEAPAKD